MSEFNRLETVEIYAEVRNRAKELVEPTSIVVTITDPNGIVVVTLQAMTLSGGITGTYDYFYTLPSDAAIGEWVARVKVTDGSGITAKYTIEDERFNVEA